MRIVVKAAFGAVMLLETAGILYPPAAHSQVVANKRIFTCTPTRVWDGDGPIWCAEGARVRLAGIASREIDSSCRRGHPCPRASGIAARDHLVRLLGGSRGRSREGHILVSGPELRCIPHGTTYDRQAALCGGPLTGELNCEMVRSRLALAWPGRGRPRVCTKRREFLF
jgi:endonuclease YncB( thermonuclease family)